jgi:hypothetical protein
MIDQQSPVLLTKNILMSGLLDIETCGSWTDQELIKPPGIRRHPYFMDLTVTFWLTGSLLSFSIFTPYARLKKKSFAPTFPNSWRAPMRTW